jgi:hypothetical protein
VCDRERERERQRERERARQRQRHRETEKGNSEGLVNALRMNSGSWLQIDHLRATLFKLAETT